MHRWCRRYLLAGSGPSLDGTRARREPRQWGSPSSPVLWCFQDQAGMLLGVLWCRLDGWLLPGGLGIVGRRAPWPSGRRRACSRRCRAGPQGFRGLGSAGGWGVGRGPGWSSSPLCHRSTRTPSPRTASAAAS